MKRKRMATEYDDLKKELINHSRKEGGNETKVRSGMSKGIAQWKVESN